MGTPDTTTDSLRIDSAGSYRDHALELARETTAGAATPCAEATAMARVVVGGQHLVERFAAELGASVADVTPQTRQHQG